MSHNLNSLKGLQRGLHGGTITGVIRGILGVWIMADIDTDIDIQNEASRHNFGGRDRAPSQNWGTLRLGLQTRSTFHDFVGLFCLDFAFHGIFLS